MVKNVDIFCNITQSLLMLRCVDITIFRGAGHQQRLHGKLTTLRIRLHGRTQRPRELGALEAREDAEAAEWWLSPKDVVTIHYPLQKIVSRWIE